MKCFSLSLSAFDIDRGPLNQYNSKIICISIFRCCSLFSSLSSDSKLKHQESGQRFNNVCRLDLIEIEKLHVIFRE